jgi:hypothetical protein
VGEVIVNTLSPGAFALAAACLLNGCAVLSSEEAVVGCQAADVVTTLHARDLGAHEANPDAARPALLPGASNRPRHPRERRDLCRSGA